MSSTQRLVESGFVIYLKKLPALALGGVTLWVEDWLKTGATFLADSQRPWGSCEVPVLWPVASPLGKCWWPSHGLEHGGKVWAMPHGLQASQVCAGKALSEACSALSFSCHSLDLDFWQISPFCCLLTFCPLCSSTISFSSSFTYYLPPTLFGQSLYHPHLFLLRNNNTRCGFREMFEMLYVWHTWILISVTY